MKEVLRYLQTWLIATSAILFIESDSCWYMLPMTLAGLIVIFLVKEYDDE